MNELKIGMDVSDKKRKFFATIIGFDKKDKNNVLLKGIYGIEFFWYLNRLEKLYK